jgi:hypothetical protein
MVRRRRRKREIEFSFDSFLDVVANVVGIILRLILVAWVAARSYQAAVPAPPPLPALAELEVPPDPTDERTPLLAQRRRELADQEATAREAENRKGPGDGSLRRDLEELRRAGDAVLARYRAAQGWAEKKDKQSRKVTLSVEELRRRSQAVLAELEALRKLPPLKKQLKYHTPVSAELQTQQVMFECKAGHVTFVDFEKLTKLSEMGAREQISERRGGRLITGSTSAVGPFRMQYEYELVAGAINGGYRSTLIVVPIDQTRGETEEAALKSGSKYRELVDYIHPKETAVTFWVYADSFSLYRTLREDLHKRGFVVAGRPLELGAPIGASWKGTASRGQ